MTLLEAIAPVLPVVGVTEPLPGFPAYRDYALVPTDGQSRVFWLQSVDPDGPRFLVVLATAFFPDYAPVFPRGLDRELQLEEGASPEVYCIVTVPEGNARDATANLRAPLVVNPAGGFARQVVLNDSELSIRRPLCR